ncbi:hypothetical protein ACLOJK_020101 [Asimina triloba]
MEDSLDADFAIRRFCPARQQLEEQLQADDHLIPGQYWESDTFYYDAPDAWSPCPDCFRLGPSEQDELQLVDSFINVSMIDQFSDHPPIPILTTTSNTLYDDDDDQLLPMIMDVQGEEVEVDPEEEEEEEEQVHVGGGAEEVVDQGLHLVHLLLACAEAVGCRDTQLATSLLNHIWAAANPCGDSLQRVSFCFAVGLKCRLSLLHPNANPTFQFPTITKEEKAQGFHLLHQTTPYIAFAFLAANNAITQAAQGKDHIHIVDLGTEHALQWPSLIRTLASRPGGPPKRLRITAMMGISNPTAEIEASMKSIEEEANSLGLAVEFRAVSGSDPPAPSSLNSETLGLREGEALFFNSIMHLHRYVKESRGSLKAVLQAVRKLSPTLLTVVEQDANHNGPFFLGRFLESLHYYSAIFDSLEAGLPRPSPHRMKMERCHFSEEIRNIVAFEGAERVERHERADQWRRKLGRAGFQSVGLRCMSQARMMVSVYGCDGYTLGSDKGCLLLGWKGRPIMLASAWQVHPNAVTS